MTETDSICVNCLHLNFSHDGNLGCSECECKEFVSGIFTHDTAPDAAEAEQREEIGITEIRRLEVDERSALERQHAATDSLWNANTELRARVSELELELGSVSLASIARKNAYDEMNRALDERDELRAKLAAAEGELKLARVGAVESVDIFVSITRSDLEELIDERDTLCAQLAQAKGQSHE